MIMSDQDTIAAAAWFIERFIPTEAARTFTYNFAGIHDGAIRSDVRARNSRYQIVFTASIDRVEVNATHADAAWASGEIVKGPRGFQFISNDRQPLRGIRSSDE
jgi:hypothetical protein